MSDSQLSKEHELGLLQKLSTDDAFRSRFEQNPAGALKEIGVPDAEIAALPAENLKPGLLADKAAIATAHQQLAEAKSSNHICMVAPFMRTNYGEESGSSKS